MPYIQMNFSRKLDSEQKTAIKTMVGNHITLLPNKSEKGLMLRIEDNTQTYFRGEIADCVYISVHLYMTSAYEKKGDFARAVITDLEAMLGIDPADTYMSFQEYNNWVAGGKIR